MNAEALNILDKLKKSLLAGLPDKFYQAAALDGGTADARLKLCEYICAALMCADKGRAPCGTCAQCAKVYAHGHPDIYFSDNSDGKLPVDAVRAIRAEAYVLPGEAEHKIFIINSADKLSVPCQNALLKVLEEPPKNVHFLLLCDNFSAMLQTVRSRTAGFSLENSGESAAIRYAYDAKTLGVASGICTALCGKDELCIFENVKRIENLDSAQISVLFKTLRVIIKNAVLYGCENALSERILPEAERLMNENLTAEQMSALADIFSELGKRCEFHANSSALIGALSAMCAKVTGCAN